MNSLLEVIEYSHKGVSVIVKIDHERGTVSLVENTADNMLGYRGKEWVFNNRGLEYMQSWQNILDAMKFAIGEATKKLEHDLAEHSKFMDESIMDIAQEILRNKDSISFSKSPVQILKPKKQAKKPNK